MGHPLLSQKSFLVLGDMLPIEISQKLMIQLGLSLDKISRIRRNAQEKFVQEEFLLLLTWCQGVRGMKEDEDLIKDIEIALKDFGRTDLAMIIAKARQEKRALNRTDMDNL